MVMLGYNMKMVEPRFAALLYHRQCPCANPAGRAMMNKQQAIRPESNHG
jgi:hypothetical protein